MNVFYISIYNLDLVYFCTSMRALGGDCGGDVGIAVGGLHFFLQPPGVLKRPEGETEQV